MLANSTSGGEAIQDPYLLVTHIDCHLSRGGVHAVDALWHKDLVEHFRYLRNFLLAAPCYRGDLPPGSRSLKDEDFSGARVEFVDLPHARSMPRAILVLPIVVYRLWRAIGRCRIVHIGVGFGPIPHGWVAGAIAILRRKVLVVVIESATWRIDPNQPSSFRHRLRAALTEWFARRLVRKATISFFTQEGYRRHYLGQASPRGHVNSASWINDEVILSDEEAAQVWRTKLEAPKALRLAYVGRLVDSKGVRVLLQAIQTLSEERVQVELNVFGSGDLMDACKEASRSLSETASIRIRGTLPYDLTFFEALRDFHALVIPSLSDEQPRIVYDAFSQAVPCIASSTDGLRQCVDHQITGLLVEPGNPKPLAEAIRWASINIGRLEQFGMASLTRARGLTHRRMHEIRRQFLLESLRAGHAALPNGD